MDKFYNKTITETIQVMDTNVNGLSTLEANKRLNKYGKNELSKTNKKNIFKMIFLEIKNPIIIILIAASLFSYISKDYTECIAILLIITLNILLGVIQELRAFKKTDALTDLIKYETLVIRDNTEMVIYSSELVIGDIVYLESGNKVGADLRIIETNNLIIDESILTGESTSVIKTNKKLKDNILLAEQKNMVFAGTIVISGRGKGVVVSTGNNTEIGKITETVINLEETPSPLTIKVDKLSKQISFLITVLAGIITILLYIKNIPGKEIFMSVIALSVSAMPEGLPLALTMALTVSSNRMSKNNVIVKKLNSVEALGSCSVIASDKTGTLTLNEQTAKKILLPSNDEFEVSGIGYNNIGEINRLNDEVYDLVKQGVINNEASLSLKNDEYSYFGDTIDVAFLSLGLKAKIEEDYKIIHEIPYESENKYSAVFYELNNKIYCTAKGSCETIMSYCNKMLINKKEVNIDFDLLESQNERLAKEGYRVIAIAKKEVEEVNESEIPSLTFLGFVSFIDPIRKEAKKSISQCQKAGIKVIMITGDHKLTATNIARELSLIKSDSEVTTGQEMKKYLEEGNESFDDYIKDKRVFARVTPLDKLAIVESYKRQDEYIAVTGDGVNDAPAIKAANIGIAMGSGTDVAKETADMIIVDDNFKSIVEGVTQGKIAYSNIRKIVYLLLSCGLAEVLFFVLAIVSDLPLPLVAVQILWLNVVTDGLQDIALSFEKGEKRVLEEKSNPKDESIFNKDLLTEVLISGIVIGIIVYLFWVFLMKRNVDLILARTYIMTLMIFMQNVHVLNCRSERNSTFKVPLNNPLLIFSISSAIILQIIITRVDIFAKVLQVTSIPYIHVLILLLMSLPLLLIMELYKKIKG